MALAGIDSGVTMRLAGEGPTDSRTGQAGNILLDIQARLCIVSRTPTESTPCLMLRLRSMSCVNSGACQQCKAI